MTTHLTIFKEIDDDGMENELAVLYGEDKGPLFYHGELLASYLVKKDTGDIDFNTLAALTVAHLVGKNSKFSLHPEGRRDIGEVYQYDVIGDGASERQICVWERVQERPYPDWSLIFQGNDRELLEWIADKRKMGRR